MLIKKIVDRIWPKWPIKKEGELFIRKLNGLKIFSNSQAVLKGTFDHIFISKIYDFQTENPAPFIIDAGANIGLASLFWKQRFPNSTILAFEPSEKVFELLLRNIKENNLSGIQCVKKALANKVSEVAFTTNEGLSGSIITEKSLKENYTVQTTLLSSYIDKTVDLLKIDIEGAELEVLEEIKPKLNYISNLFIEYHSFTHKSQELSKIIEVLEQANFRYYIQGEGTINSPFNGVKVILGQDLKLNIWASNISSKK